MTTVSGLIADPTVTSTEDPTGTCAAAGVIVIGGWVGDGAAFAAGVTDGAGDATGDEAGKGDGDGGVAAMSAA